MKIKWAEKSGKNSLVRLEIRSLTLIHRGKNGKRVGLKKAIIKKRPKNSVREDRNNGGCWCREE